MDTNDLSAIGANPSIPDMTPMSQARHTKHLQAGKSYPGMSMEEYVRKSGELARSEVGGDVDGYKASDGGIIRYNRITGDWVKAYTTGVASMYKPKRGIDYFNDTRIEDGG
ncbi:MAG: hypothetical protein FWE11_05700 [Defluviitaleaceae bacterium]|nr:hypothetical protein [Defluviitaleaceae bacterium]